MRGKRTFLAAVFAALAAGTGGAPAAAGALSPPAEPRLGVPTLRELPPPPADAAFEIGVSAEPHALFRLPEAAEPRVEGPFARYEERRSARASLVPRDLGPGDDRFADNATFFPLLGGALLLAWLALSGWRPAPRKTRRRRRRSSRSGAAGAAPSTAA